MGKMIYLTLLLCLPGIALAGQDSLRVVYRHLNFHIPADPLLVGLLGSDSNIVIAKYSGEPGQKIIGFSVEQDLEFADCEPGIFFEEVLDVTAAGCEAQSVAAFRHVFVRNRETGVWRGEDYRFFYFLGPKKSTVFMLGEQSGGEIYKIESNFQSKRELRRVLSDYLAPQADVTTSN